MTPTLAANQMPIAIVGVSALFPGSSDAAGFWRDILEGRDLITDVPASHWLIDDYYDADPAAPDKTYARRGGFLDPVGFDSLGFGVPPSSLPATDTAQLLALILAQSVLQDAARAQFETMDRSRISVILGVTSAQELLFSMVSRLQKPVWVKALREAGLAENEVQDACQRIADHYVPWQESSFPGLLGNVVAGRIANRLNLGGTNCVTDAACASALSALSMAISELQLGNSDLVISGGVDTLNDIFMYMCFSKTPALSPSGDCRPFSDQADGTMLGEGLGMVALKRLADAERDGDRIYAVIRGLGSSSDGRSKSVYAPVSEGQAQALRRAYEIAGYGPETVELMEAHGTGTKAGDAAEFEGLRQVFGPANADRQQWCALGSVKSQIGHTKAAAGAAGLFKAVMALHHKVLPPTIKVDAPNPKLDIEHSPFYLNTQARPWIRDSAHPRRASVSAFGFGGSNFHVALEEYTGEGARADRLPAHGFELLLLSADSTAALLEKASALIGNNESLATIARQSRRDFRPIDNRRLALVASTRAQLNDRLQSATQRMATAPENVFNLPDGSSYGVGARSGKLALLFPGQGSQYTHMGSDLAMHFSAARAVWDVASDVLSSEDMRLHDRVFPPARFDDEARSRDSAQLTDTRCAQPAIGATSLAMLEVLNALGVEGECFAGHSFGEVVALHAAGAVPLDHTLKIAQARGEHMARAAATPGAMVALSLSVDEVSELLARYESAVVIANHNAPQQVVLSGSRQSIEDFEAQLSADNISFRRLAVASGFHSSVVERACAPFAAFLADIEFATPRRTVYSNARASAYEADAHVIRQSLAAQIAQPVRFVEMIEAMHADGAYTFIEVGPSSVLTGLASAILGSRPHCAISLDRKNKNGVESLLLALARLSAEGIAWQPERLFDDVREPASAPTHGRPLTPITGSNVGKPYPPTGGSAALPPPNPPRAAPLVRAADSMGSVESIPTFESAPNHMPMNANAQPLTAPIVDSSPTTPHSDSSAWLAAFQASQQQLTDAHSSFQRAMFDSHSAFLQLSESALSGLAAIATGQPQPARIAAVIAPPAMPASATHSAPTPTRAPAPAQTPASPAQLQTQHAAVATPAPVPAASAAPAPVSAPIAQKLVAPDLTALMLQIVAEKTGYPVEMLDLSMDMEGDLGIDSIKRVEILAAVDERASNLPKLDRGAMSAMHTLAEIVSYLQGTQTLEPATINVATVNQPTATAAAEHARDLTSLMLQVVAEKTGYPVEMLSLDMDMEGDLGIDSIKRVEILAAVEERASGLPKLDRSLMSALHTLREIVSYLGGNTPSPAASSVSSEQHKQPTIPTASTSIQAAAASSLGRYRLQSVSAPAIGMAMAGLRDGSLWLVGEPTLANALARELTSRGIPAQAAQTLPPSASACVYLGGVREVANVDEAIAINREAFAIARQLATSSSKANRVMVTVQDTGGRFGLGPMDPRRAWLAGLPALIKTAALEWPTARLKAIDLERGDRDAATLAKAVADELLLGGGEIEVMLDRDGQRSTLCSVATPVLSGEAIIVEGDVVLVTGGARGVTAACVIEWARDSRASFVLLGRSALQDEPDCCNDLNDEAALKRALLDRAHAKGATPTPAQLSAEVGAVLASREIQATLTAISATGARVRYAAVDATDRSALSALIADVGGQWGPIRGVIHAAGVLADKRIDEKSDAMFDRVFDTKVRGLQALIEATREEPLKLLAVFSSVSARCGNTGQADYAMANEVLAKVMLAEARDRPDLVTKSFGWGPWESGMVTPHLRERFASLGVPMIPLHVGARMFADELTRAAPDQIELVLGGEPRAEALLFDGAAERVQRLDISVARQSHAYLEGHAIHGLPVVPLMLAAEWLGRAARSFRPGLSLTTLHDVKVLKGIRLGGFENGGDHFAVEATPLPSARGAQLAMRIVDGNGQVNYRARVEMLPTSTASDPHSSGPQGSQKKQESELSLDAWKGAPLYEDLLFHRGAFELIDTLDGISDHGIQASLRGVSHAGWDSEAWQLDVAALDGGLQLAVLFGQRLLGGPNLPTSIDQIRAFGMPPSDGLLSATAYRRTLGATALTTDILFTNSKGQRVAELIGVSNHALA